MKRDNGTLAIARRLVARFYRQHGRECRKTGTRQVSNYRDRRNHPEGSTTRGIRKGRIRRIMQLENLAKEIDRVRSVMSRNFFQVEALEETFNNPPDVPHGAAVYAQLLRAAGRLGVPQVEQITDFRILNPNAPSGALGVTNPRFGIKLKAGRNKTQLAVTLAHELSHWVAHANIASHHLPCKQDEVEAEASAYLVLAHLGIDWSPAAVYLTWLKVRSTDLFAYRDTIVGTANAILAAANL